MSSPSSKQSSSPDIDWSLWPEPVDDDAGVAFGESEANDGTPGAVRADSTTQGAPR